MLELLIDSILDVSKVSIKALSKAFQLDSNNKITRSNLEQFFRHIDLTNKNMEENNIPTLISILEQTEKVDKFIVSNPYLSITCFISKEEQFKNYLQSQLVKFEYDYNNQNIIVTSYKQIMKNHYAFKYVKCQDYQFFGGYNLYEDECIFSLRRNMLLSGSVGQGKTSTLQGILLNRLWNNKNNNECVGTDINIIDLKGTDLVYFEGLEGIENIATDTKGAKELLEKIKNEMENRNKLFREKKVSSIEDYNEISKEKMRYKYLVIDELATFQELKKEEKEEINNLFLIIISKARSAGIISLGSTQRPDSKTLDSFIKAQLSGAIVGHKVNNKYTSETIINRPGLEDLKVPGQAIILADKEEITQVSYLSTKELKARIKKDF